MAFVRRRLVFFPSVSKALNRMGSTPHTKIISRAARDFIERTEEGSDKKEMNEFEELAEEKPRRSTREKKKSEEGEEDET